MSTFKFKAEKTLTFTEKELARLLTNHLCMYVTINTRKVLPEDLVKQLQEKTLEEMREKELIQNLNREYSTIIEEAHTRGKEEQEKQSKNG